MSYSYKYPRPSVTTDSIVIAKESDQSFILLIERGNAPYKNMWALPGGFIDMDEDLLDACKRELQEETGITNIKLYELATFGKPGRDPRGRTISIVFWGQVDNNIAIKAGDDAARVQWFEMKNLPQLAFDHQEIIQQFKNNHPEFSI
ncbi:MAG: NUDIX hydrolase [Prolixibacteraceae bacterium]|jgi:8-oxo-dGTP diphosphatase|nr:NUDIX hydrolase [Prolixibacteraceae bacterium]